MEFTASTIGARAGLLRHGSLLLLATVPVIKDFRSSFDNPDEVMMLTNPMLVMQGHWPHVDFATAYGGPSFVALAGIYDLFGANPSVERLTGLTLHIALTFGIFAMTRRFGTWPAWTSAATCALLLQTLGIFVVPYVAGLALLAWGISLVGHETSRWHWFTAGVLGGLATGCRYELALVSLGVALPWLTRQRRLWILGGAAIGGIPTALFFVLAFDGLLSNVLLDRINGNFQVDQSWVEADVYVLLALCVGSTVGLLLAAFRTKDRWLWSTGLASLFMLPQAFQRIDIWHEAIVGSFVLPAALAAGLGSPTMRGLVARAWITWVKRAAFATTAFLLGVYALGASVVMANPPDLIEHDEKQIRLPGEWADDTAALAAAVEERVPPGSRLFVGAQDMSYFSNGFFPIFYLLTPTYRFEQYYVEVANGIAGGRWSEIAKDVEDADALILWHFPREGSRRLAPNVPSGNQTINDAVRKDFCEVAEHGALQLYLRCER